MKIEATLMLEVRFVRLFFPYAEQIITRLNPQNTRIWGFSRASPIILETCAILESLAIFSPSLPPTTDRRLPISEYSAGLEEEAGLRL
jgi:hypothetical protein